METSTGLHPHILRWITPSPGQLERVIAYRNQQKAGTTSGAGTPTANSVGSYAGNFIGITRKRCVSDAHRLVIAKEVHCVTKANPPLNRLKGLKIPDSMFKSDKAQVCVYFLSEELAADLEIRKRVRCRKKKPLSCDGSKSKPVEPKQVDPVIQGEETCGKNKIRPGWIPYDRFFSLSTRKLKYYKSSWFSLPGKKFEKFKKFKKFVQIESHPLEIIRHRSLGPAAKILFKAMLSQNVLEKYTITTDDLVELCQSEVLNAMMTKPVRFHRRTRYLHSILKNCLGKWVWKERKKEARKSKKQGDQIQSVDLTKTFVSANGDTLNEPQQGPSRKRIAEDSFESLGRNTYKRTRLATSPLSPNLLVSFENLPLSSLSLSPTIPVNPSVDIQRRALRFRKLQGKISANCIIATVSQMLHESGFSAFLGSRSNIRKFLKFVRRAIFLGGTKSNLQLWQLMQGLNADDCKWLDCVEHPKVKVYLLAKVASWIFLEYVIVMLRCSFYVTESSSSRNHLEFYLRSTWKSVTDSLHYQMMKTQNMKLIPEPESPTPTANLRFVPKTNNNLRPILAFSKEYKKTISTETGKLLLAYMSAKIAPHGVIDPVHLQNRWQDFLKDWNNMNCPTLYFLRSDIRDAYPSVKIPKLTTILNTMEIPHNLKQRTYKWPNSAKNIFRGKTVLQPAHEGMRESLYFRNRPWVNRPGFRLHIEQDFDALSALKSVIRTLKAAVVKIGNHLYTLDLGLPQGWQLSQHLCNIYYGTMDKEHFSEYLNKPGEFFIRNVDDYFFITTDPQRVARLRHKMEKGIKEFNCAINSDKSWSNLYIRSNESVNDLRNSEIKFFGWKFSLAAGHVSRDFESYKGLDICSTLTFAMSAKVTTEEFIARRLKILTPLRFHALMFNTNFNCRPTVWRNVFEGALMVSFRFCAMCRVLYPSLSALSEDAVIMGRLYAGLVRCAKLIARTVMNLQNQTCREKNVLFRCGEVISPSCEPKLVTKLGKQPHKRTVERETISESELLFVVFHAFVLKMSQHKAVFKKNLLPRLLRKKNLLASKPPGGIGEGKTNDILTAVGINLPYAFAQMKK